MVNKANIAIIADIEWAHCFNSLAVSKLEHLLNNKSIQVATIHNLWARLNISALLFEAQPIRHNKNKAKQYRNSKKETANLFNIADITDDTNSDIEL